MLRRLSVDEELGFLRPIVAHDQHGLLNSLGVKGGAATNPHDIGIAGLAVFGVGLPAAGIHVDGGPRGVIAKPVDALLEGHLGNLRG